MEVIDLVELVSFNLSRNNLIGPIPVTIGQLKSLHFLDLSQKQLQGGIPDSVSQIANLSVLDKALVPPHMREILDFVGHLFWQNVRKMNLGKCLSLILVEKKRMVEMMQMIYGFMEALLLDSSSDFGEFAALYCLILHGDMPISGS